MSRYVEGLDRRQSFLLPESIQDYVGEDNPVRVIDVFVDRIDLSELGFGRAVPADTGRPGYHPATLLKLYLYGYLNSIPSSRRLEREAQRNLELMWLTNRLAPDFKMIADFRRDNGAAIRGTCRQFVMLCRQMDLLSEVMVAIDGSKFKAVNARDKNFTPAKLQHRIEQIEESVARYMAAMDTADRQENAAASPKSTRLGEKIERLKVQMQRLRDLQIAVKAAPDEQISLTDPDSRSMATSGKGTGIVGYNVQAAVDARHHLIVAHDVTNVGHDRAELARMATQAKDAMGHDQITAVADRGYFSGWEIYRCEQAGIVPYVPKPLTSGAKFEGRFGKQDFVYLPGKDVYRCPAGEHLKWWYDRLEDGKVLRHYWTTKCRDCAVKADCTTGKERRIKRWEHEAVLDAMQQRLDQAPQAMAIRRQTVEHIFGTIKA
jgi:transposase